MGKKHLKKIAMPKTWHIERKDYTFTVRPNPGAHSMEMSMPLITVIRELIKCAKSSKESKIILHNKNIVVNGKRRKEKKFPVGLMDVIELEEIKEYYRILLNKKGKLFALAIKKDETGIKPCRINNKTVVGKDKIQLNLSDGRNILVKKDEYKAGDTIVLALPDQNIKQHFKLENGALVYLTGGKYVGNTANLERIEGKTIAFRHGNDINDIKETLKKYAFVIGRDKPVISLSKEKE